MTRVVICVLIMALVTYLPRVLPITVIRKKIKSPFVKSFLEYTPYAVLGAMTFPDIFYSTGNYISAVIATVIALILGAFKRSLVEVALVAIAVVWIVEIIL